MPEHLSSQEMQDEFARWADKQGFDGAEAQRILNYYAEKMYPKDGIYFDPKAGWDALRKEWSGGVDPNSPIGREKIEQNGEQARRMVRELDRMTTVTDAEARVAEEKKWAPVREAQARMKPYLDEAKLILNELRRLSADYLPTLRKLSEVKWNDIMRRREPGINRAAFLAENTLNAALSVLDSTPRYIEQTIIATYTNLSPVDCKGRDPVKYFVMDVELARGAPGGVRRSLLELHEKLQDLDRALTLAARDRDPDRQTFSIPLGPETRGPEPPKTTADIPQETQTHATM